MKHPLCFAFYSALFVILLSCQDSIELVDLSSPGEVIEDPEGDDSGDTGNDDRRIIITDRTGKEWDITHAVEKYGFDPGGFQFGLGPDAIKPITNPRMLCPGDDGYPENEDGSLIMGVELNGLTRAYSLAIMSRHEVALEQFAGTDVAVAY